MSGEAEKPALPYPWLMTGDRDPQPIQGAQLPADQPVCEICGAATLTWRNCKLICLNCRSIVKSCADL